MSATTKISLLASVWFLAVTTASAQQPTHPPASPVPPAVAKLCDNTNGPGLADGFPEGPVYILLHRENSKAPWARNPAIQAPGLDVANPANARTLVCVEESRSEVGKYDTGESGYQASWYVSLVRLSDGKMYSVSPPSFDGANPPMEKYTPGAATGKPPIQPFLRWLRLLVDQKLANFVVHIPAIKETYNGQDAMFENVAAMAFSRDDTKLVVALLPHETVEGGTPPTPLVVYDVAASKPITTLYLDYTPWRVAINNSGSLIAADRYGTAITIWDVASSQIVHKFDTGLSFDSGHLESLLFGPNGSSSDGALAFAGVERAVVWDVSSERQVLSGTGSQIMLAAAGAWLVASRTSSGTTINELQSGRQIASFPAIEQNKDFFASPGGAVVTSEKYYETSIAMFTNGGAQRDLTLPSIKMDETDYGRIEGITPTADGFAYVGDCFVGLASIADPEVHFFATDIDYIKSVAVSPDGKLLVIGDNMGNLSIWRLR